MLIRATLPLLLAAGALAAQGVQAPAPAPATAPKATLAIGDPAPPLKVMRWIKGGPVKALEKGQVYVVEFWATWCAPCKVAIPHLTELAHRHKGKVTFIGVSVREKAKPGQDLEGFIDGWVKEMGPKMDYAVARDTSDNFMHEQWYVASRRGGIPAAFVVDREGRIAWMGHPDALDTALEKVLTGSVDMEAARKTDLDKIKQADASKALQLTFTELRAQYRPKFLAAEEKQDWKHVLALLAEIEAGPADPKHKQLLGMQLMGFRVKALAAVDRPGLQRLWEDIQSGKVQGKLQVAHALVDLEGLDRVWYDRALEVIEPAVKNPRMRVAGVERFLAKAYFRVGRAREAAELQATMVAMFEKHGKTPDEEMAKLKAELARYRAAIQP